MQNTFKISFITIFIVVLYININAQTINNRKEFNYNNDTLPQQSNDKTVANISFLIEGEENGIIRLSNLKDTIKLYPSTENLKLNNSTTNNIIYKSDDFFIKSFSFAAIYENTVKEFNTKENIFSNEMREFLFNSNGLTQFYIDNFIVVDKCGIEYRLGSRRFELKK